MDQGETGSATRKGRRSPSQSGEFMISREFMPVDLRGAILCRLLADLNDWPDYGRFCEEDSSAAEDPVRFEQARVAYRPMLKACVNEWLDSGFSEGGKVEEPLN